MIDDDTRRCDECSILIDRGHTCDLCLNRLARDHREREEARKNRFALITDNGPSLAAERALEHKKTLVRRQLLRDRQRRVISRWKTEGTIR